MNNSQFVWETKEDAISDLSHFSESNKGIKWLRKEGDRSVPLDDGTIYGVQKMTLRDLII